MTRTERAIILKRLSQAQRNVFRGADNVRRQRNLIAELESSDGQETEAALARLLLVRLEDSLAVSVEVRDRIGRELVEFDRHLPQVRFSNDNQSP